MAQRPKRIISALFLALALLVAGPSFAAEEQHKVNLNSAGAQELTSLRGIGQKTAAAIVEYRESHGPFKSIDDLVEVKGIGEKLLASLRDHVTVGETASAGAAPAAKAKPGS
jgi:competence protein ComEA